MARKKKGVYVEFGCWKEGRKREKPFIYNGSPTEKSLAKSLREAKKRCKVK